MAYPSDAELTEVAKVKSAAKIAATETGADGAILLLIQGASGAVKKYLGRGAIISQAVSEKRNGKISNKLILQQHPVTAVSLLKIDGSAIPASTGVTVSGYVFTKTAVHLRGYCFTAGTLNVEVSYQAGYDPDGEDFAAIERAVIMTCVAWWKKRDKPEQASSSVPGVGSASNFSRDLPAEARFILNQYKRRVPVAD